MLFDLPIITQLYVSLPRKLKEIRRIIDRPLTLTEKILYTHTSLPMKEVPVKGKTYVDFAPDRVAMQDATAQMALLQFASSGKPKTAVPATVHCDHLIQAETGAVDDLNVEQIWHWFLESRSRDHSPGRFRKLRLPWWIDDRDRFPYTKCWRFGHVGYWCWWS